MQSSETIVRGVCRGSDVSLRVGQWSSTVVLFCPGRSDSNHRASWGYRPDGVAWVEGVVPLGVLVFEGHRDEVVVEGRPRGRLQLEGLQYRLQLRRLVVASLGLEGVHLGYFVFLAPCLVQSRRLLPPCLTLLRLLGLAFVMWAQDLVGAVFQGQFHVVGVNLVLEVVWMQIGIFHL